MATVFLVLMIWISEMIMESSYLLAKAVWPSGSIVLIILGGSLIALALFSSQISSGKLVIRCKPCEALKDRVTHSLLGKIMAKKDLIDEYE